MAAPAALPADAQDADPGGTLNPDELSMDRMIQNAREGRLDMITCASGYAMTKKGDHDIARETFGACAEAGWTAAMTWMSQLDNNGLGGPYDPDAAAEWSRRAAEAGDPIGKFNYGLDLIRGHGVARDEAAGRALVDQAAAEGVAQAVRLRNAGYDPDEVTPDADAWRYGPMF
ncbi:sel1 repeat family protein [Paracoccus sp. M683]|nr:sel1 repeat family protein [Paracoccus sp. M683]TRW99729.1 sel1 repeat family protein [Paracoccus sp. M683]